MKKIINPWQNHTEYNCFGCCPDNPIGLHMEFYEDGDNSLVHITLTPLGYMACRGKCFLPVK